jgi:hypothetical protein
MKTIRSVDQLKKEAISREDTGVAEFFILLSGGIISAKRIIYYPDTDQFDIYNKIDDSFQDNLTEEELDSNTSIVQAIERGTFFKYDF